MWPAFSLSAAASSSISSTVSDKQDLPRHRLVVVELRQKGVQHLGARKLRIGLREIGAVAPVLAGAEEEHLDAGNAALVVDREDVGFLDTGRIDALVALHMRKRRKPVAVDRGALEIEVLRRRVHRLGHMRLDVLALAGEEILRLLHQLGIAFIADLMRAGAEQRLIW